MKSTNYRPDIDGLRAIAVISVIVFHLNNKWLTGGFIGVDIFFVISGYLITKTIFIEINEERFNFKNFYLRRINRILPAFFIVMFFTSIAAWYILIPADFLLFLNSLKSTTYLWENMFFANNTGGYFNLSADKMPILHTWSLAVEEQFYIILPFILLILFKLKCSKRSIYIILLLISLLSFTLAQLSPYSLFLQKYNYYSLFTGRAGELLIGSIIGIYSINQKNSLYNLNNSFKNIITIICFLIIIVSTILISKTNLFPSFLAVVPTLSVALIIICNNRNILLSRILSLKPIVYIGTLSYSLYLWHWPIIVLYKQYLNIDEFNNPLQYIIVISSTFILSLLTFYLIEKPCRKYVKDFKKAFTLFYLLPTVIILSLTYFHSKTRYFDTIFTGRFTSEKYIKKSRYINGKNDFLFLGNSYNRTIEKLTLQIEPTKENINDEYLIYKNITDVAKQYNTKVALIIGPNKSSIYKEYLPDYIKPSNKRYIDHYTDKLNMNNDLILYDPYSDLLKNSSLNNKLTYYRTDTHWNKLGSYIAYYNLLNLLNIPSLKVKFESIPSVEGDLIEISQLQNFKLHNDDNFKIDLNYNNLSCKTIEINPNSFGDIEECENKNPLVDKIVWIVGDSFTIAMRDYIKSTFKKSYFIGHWDEKLSELPTKMSKSSIKPDYIFIIKVERSFL